MYSCRPPHMDEQMLDDQQEPIYHSSVPIQDVAWKTYRERQMIETGGKRGSGKSVLVARHDDDEELYIYICCRNKVMYLQANMKT